jgi:hypothetical protein
MVMTNSYWTPEIWYLDDKYTHKDRVGWCSACIDFYSGHAWFDFGVGQRLVTEVFRGFYQSH